MSLVVPPLVRWIACSAGQEALGKQVYVNAVARSSALDTELPKLSSCTTLGRCERIRSGSIGPTFPHSQ